MEVYPGMPRAEDLLLAWLLRGFPRAMGVWCLLRNSSFGPSRPGASFALYGLGWGDLRTFNGEYQSFRHAKLALCPRLGYAIMPATE